jgi:hypothetical protein
VHRFDGQRALKQMRQPGLDSRVVALPIGVAILFGVACSAPQKKPAAPPAGQPQILSNTRSSISEEDIGHQFGVASLTEQAPDPAYARSEKSPVLVGGGFGEGSHNTYRFLNALLGPAGQQVHYTRIGTCCAFKSPNAPFGGEGLLEVYEISYEGGKPERLYFDWYDSGHLYIPQGLSARK